MGFSYRSPFRRRHTRMLENRQEQIQLEEANGPGAEGADKSEALFAMYLERADDDDNKVTERWKNETGTLLTFVGALAFQCNSHVNARGCRLVFSQPLSQPFLLFLSWTFGRVHRIPQRSMSQIFIIYSLTPLRLNPSFSPRRSTHLVFLRQDTQSGSTHSGS